MSDEVMQTFTNSLMNLLRPICEVRQILAEEDRIAVNDGLARIGDKSEVVALGEMAQVLARDIIIVLRDSYEDDLACASMAARLEEAEKDLAVVLDEIRQRSFNGSF